MALHPFRRSVIRLEGQRSQHFSLAHGRLALISAVFFVAYIFLAARAFDLAVVQGQGSRGIEYVYQLVSGQVDSVAVVQADVDFEHWDDDVDQGAESHVYALKDRGKIYDREGVLLATNLPMASLYVDPSLVTDTQILAKKLLSIFPEMDLAHLMKSLRRSGRFVWIKRNISPEKQDAVLRIGDPSLGFKSSYSRYYPQGALASHFLGYTSLDGNGLSGIERGLQNQLAQGHDVSLSLDIRLQHILHRELTRSIDEFSAKAGTGLIMDVNTGEILAGVSYPDYNPHKAGAVNGDERFNRLSLGVYELGSVFKIFSTAAVLDELGLGMDQTFDATKPIQAGRFRIHDYHAKKRIMTLPEVFMYSSNIGSALMGKMLGTEKLRSFYDELNLLNPIRFDIKEIGRPLVPSPWRDVNTLTASYGHGLAITPLQLSAAVAAVVNGGLYYNPTLVKRETMHAAVPMRAKTQHDVEAGLARRVISAETSEKMRQLMRLVVTDGTARKADVPGLEVGGKTGTAEKVGKNGRYERKKLISSFVGMFPASNPKYLVMIMVDEPKGNKKSFGYATAGWVAAPAANRVISSMASLLGMTPKVTAEYYGAGLKQYISVEKEG